MLSAVRRCVPLTSVTRAQPPAPPTPVPRPQPPATSTRNQPTRPSTQPPFRHTGPAPKRHLRNFHHQPPVTGGMPIRILAAAILVLLGCHPGNIEAKRLRTACDGGNVTACDTLGVKLQK